MTPDEYCQDKTAKSGSSFYYSFLFLPEAQRKAITTLYAFCREVDDVVDECSDTDLARSKLNWWRAEIFGTFDDKPSHPVCQALTTSIANFNLPREHFIEIIDGMEMDLQQTRYDTFAELNLYCYRVASVVGLMAAEIFGFKDRSTLDYAHNLGLAFQLTNILRDVKEDAERGRIYLPLEELEKFAVSEQDILENRCTDNMKKLLDFQAQRAQDCYDKAFALLPEADRYAQRTGLIMASIYRTTLNTIQQDSCQVLTQRISSSPLKKLWIAWRTARTEKRRHKRFQKKPPSLPNET
ncbi:MAG: presqualene diphosphate synthase HpnD [Gammaproteobacteria bacterium]|nr:presqualene diphosphate synthase HpnD [Gammaproteobacteria bacterium]MCF6261887.1 presqualene diphosphate synthase HpnD [Gammaproteobacteria bacterium]